MAWVDLQGQVTDIFMSDRLDGKRTPDGRYFQVPPGAHELEARYDFEVTGGGGGWGLDSDMQTIRCTLWVRYEHFEAGQRYRLQARSLGFTRRAGCTTRPARCSPKPISATATSPGPHFNGRCGACWRASPP